jgi:DNA-binding transcriptional ArsR family regulator
MRHRSVTYSPASGSRQSPAKATPTSANLASAKLAEATFQALADPTRRAVLDLLRRGSQPAGQIAGAFPLTRPAISKHLSLLRRAHLVREHREGRNRVYHLNPAPLRAVDSWIDQYRSFWATSLTNLKTFVEAEHARETEAAARSEIKATTERKKL